MDDRFSATVEKIYAAAGDQSRWPEALAAIEELTGSAGAVVHIVPKRDTEKFVSLLGSSAQGYFLADHVEEWTRDYAALCPRLAAASRWPDAPYYVDYMLMSERELDLHPVYDWYGSYGLRYFIGSRLCHDDGVEIVWSLQRRREQGHAQGEDIDIFQRLKPHLARSLRLAREVGSLASFQRLGSAVLEALPQAVFALDAGGRVVHANAAALKLLAKADGLAIANGHLHPAQPAEQALLDRLIREAANGIAAGSGWAKASRASGAAPYALFVAPLPGGDENLLAAGAAVLVIVHDPGARCAPDPQVLTSVYGLTETEARLACAITAGHSLETAAASLSMGLGTARFHLKHVFAKLGVNRQQDLVRLLTSLASLGR